ncbi:MAG: hypothetical protein ACKPE3_07125 [Sphaerospermopsis kisseleviana]
MINFRYQKIFAIALWLFSQGAFTFFDNYQNQDVYSGDDKIKKRAVKYRPGVLILN